MKVSSIAVMAAVFSFLAPAAHAQNAERWSGSYVGAEAGSVDNELKSGSYVMADAGGSAYALVAGVRHQNGWSVLGAEFSVATSDAEEERHEFICGPPSCSDTYTVDLSRGMSWQGDARLTFGAAYGNLLFGGFAGIRIAEVNESQVSYENGLFLDTYERDEYYLGPVYGLSVNWAATERLAIGLRVERATLESAETRIEYPGFTYAFNNELTSTGVMGRIEYRLQ